MHFSTALLLCSTSLAAAAPWQKSLKYVLAFSVDGFHSSDVEKYIALRPKSTIASLLATGYEYQNAFTSAPSDSFPGSIAKYTGGSPRTTGIWYDDLWDPTWYDAGSDCSGPPGAEVQYAENLDYNSSFVFSGGIDPENLPMALVNGKCTAMYPHSRLLVNTVFEVVSQAGLQTAYVDKHPAYELMNGPSGKGLTVGYFPEIAAVANTINATIEYDSLHVQAWLDFIDGTVPVNATGSLKSMPALMGGNFQALSVAQKIVGYNKDLSFTAGVIQALDFVDTSLGKIVAKLKSKGYLEESLIIVASKHGQAPINPAALKKIDPEAVMNATGVPTAWATTDDIALIWLNSSSSIPTAVANLQSKAASLGIDSIIYGQDLITQGFGGPSSRRPDIIVKVKVGIIYTTASKVEEHGGLSDDDRHVACFISNPKYSKQVITDLVSTRQVAPTILQALGLDPKKLQSVVAEGTQALPGTSSQWGDW